MKKTIALILSVLLFSSLTFCEDFLYKIKIENKWGYINKEGTLIIDPKFKIATEFNEGKCVGHLDDNSYIYDAHGKLLKTVKNCDVWTFSEGLASFTFQGNIGYLSDNFNVVIKPQYKWAEPFTDGIACVSEGYDDNWYFINKKDEKLFNKEFTYCYSFNEGYAVVKEGKYRKLINKKGKYYKFRDDFTLLSDKVADGMVTGKIKDVRYIVNLKDNKYIRIGKDFLIEDFSEGYAVITDLNKNKDGLIDKEGKRVIECKYEDLNQVKDGLLRFLQNDKYGFIDIKEHIVIDPVFDEVFDFENGFAHFNARNGREGGYLSKEGRIYKASDYIEKEETK